MTFSVFISGVCSLKFPALAAACFCIQSVRSLLRSLVHSFHIFPVRSVRSNALPVRSLVLQTVTPILKLSLGRYAKLSVGHKFAASWSRNPTLCLPLRASTCVPRAKTACAFPCFSYAFLPALRSLTLKSRLGGNTSLPYTMPSLTPNAGLTPHPGKTPTPVHFLWPGFPVGSLCMWFADFLKSLIIMIDYHDFLD